MKADDGGDRRAPPAYLVYASDDLAKAGYYTLSLAERGLFEAMYRVIWCDGSIPADAAGIALAVRRPEPEVQAGLTEALLSRFEPLAEGSFRLVSPDLNQQMKRLLLRIT